MDRDEPSRKGEPKHARQRELAARLRSRLIELELSQAQLSRQTGIDASTLNKILHGKRRPNAAHLGGLAHALGLDLRELLAVPPPPDLQAQLDEANRRLAEVEVARVEAEAAATERVTKLEVELGETARARETTEAELERVQRELAKANQRLAEFELLNSASARGPRRARQESTTTHPIVTQIEVDTPEFELRRAKAGRSRDLTHVVGTLATKVVSELVYSFVLARPTGSSS